MGKTNLIFTGTHYDIDVKMCYIPEDYTHTKIINNIKSQVGEIELLPTYSLRDNRYPIDVLKYTVAGKQKFCVISGFDNCYYITPQLPIDGDIEGLIIDIMDQHCKKRKPVTMPSKLNALLWEYKRKADDFLKNDNYYNTPEEIEKRNELELLLRSNIEKYPAKYSSYFAECRCDEYSGEDEEDEKEDVINYLLYWQVLAYLLDKDNYTYDYIEYIAQLDHHDVTLWAEYLINLKIAYER